MPIDMAPKTGMVSLFIVDSVLDDLMDLINNKSDWILGQNDQIVMLHEELFLLGSSVTSIAVQQEAEQQELIIKTRDVAFEVEYVINSFPPVWYLTLRHPQLIEKIQLIMMAIKEMKNDIDVAGMAEIAKYPGEHLSLQPKDPSILEDVIVGFEDVALEIAEQLVRGAEQLQIIFIFGMPGLGRRYLIVLDDIWDTKLWDDLKGFFPNDRTGSRILFTTRNKEKVFRDKSCPQELLDIAKEIAKKCHGLPLAVVVIAGVLANMEKKEHLWQEVARNLSSHLSKNSDNYIQILELSYYHLPMHLKPCFLYFGDFKEDEEIHIQKFISLWIAEGYIKKEEQKSLEDVALEYAMKLIDRSLVLVGKKKFDGSIKTCKIQDLLSEIVLIMVTISDDRITYDYVFTSNDDESHPLLYFSEVGMYQKHHCRNYYCHMGESLRNSSLSQTCKARHVLMKLLQPLSTFYSEW
ncbi:putative disease resistance RPP13-like protein 3 [Olea europaea var. sylvestris]|uniref:putative disease resistance RPP13-like protein 3 n=1 Tax=Olea europaea var. sylvestris TaxID=158386 RepID=UPI000C1D445E|nr:putative disease resistance RPP13-like protein 3 [Olea europaea var. sylvestris]